eukprot:SAG31_NODE_19208_length_609_cov_0.986275_2_plen_51_part_01
MLRALVAFTATALSNGRGFAPTKCGLGDQSMLTRYGAAVLRDCLDGGGSRH